MSEAVLTGVGERSGTAAVRDALERLRVAAGAARVTPQPMPIPGDGSSLRGGVAPIPVAGPGVARYQRPAPTLALRLWPLYPVAAVILALLLAALGCGAPSTSLATPHHLEVLP